MLFSHSEPERAAGRDLLGAADVLAEPEVARSAPATFGLGQERRRRWQSGDGHPPGVLVLWLRNKTVQTQMHNYRGESESRGWRSSAISSLWLFTL